MKKYGQKSDAMSSSFMLFCVTRVLTIILLLCVVGFVVNIVGMSWLKKRMLYKGIASLFFVLFFKLVVGTAS